jgi:hypothetical protein
MIFDLLKDLNQDCNFTENIKESSHVQSLSNAGNDVTNVNTTNTSKKYKTFVECILCEFDPLYSKDIDLQYYLNSKTAEMCSHIEEKSDTCYDNYNFNPKVMRVRMIQQGLQLWQKENNISSIYYLNDYFKKHFVIVHGGCAYMTTIKYYPKVYLEYNNGICITDEKDFVIKNLTELFEKSKLKNDMKRDLKSVYKNYLEVISKYKIDDLKKIALECNISLKDSKGKNKTKGVLYDEINLMKLNV